MRVTVDTKKCISAGQCVLSAPDVFDQREEDGIVTLNHPSPFDEVHEGARYVLVSLQPTEELVADVEQAAMLCPALAITIEPDP